MNTLTQIAHFRQSVVTYSFNFSIQKAFCTSTSLAPLSTVGAKSIMVLLPLSKIYLVALILTPTSIRKKSSNLSLICVEEIPRLVWLSFG